MDVYSDCSEYLYSHVFSRALREDLGSGGSAVWIASNRREGNAMKVQVRITRTGTGSNTRIRANNREASKNYASWAEALVEAERIGLLSGVEATAAQVMPPGMPFHTNSEVDSSVLSTEGFVSGKTSPPQ